MSVRLSEYVDVAVERARSACVERIHAAEFVCEEDLPSRRDPDDGSWTYQALFIAVGECYRVIAEVVVAGGSCDISCRAELNPDYSPAGDDHEDGPITSVRVEECELEARYYSPEFDGDDD